MITTTPDTRPAPTPTDQGDELLRISCRCTPDVTLCGLTDCEDAAGRGKGDCVVCHDLERLPCPGCGR